MLSGIYLDFEKFFKNINNKKSILKIIMGTCIISKHIKYKRIVFILHHYFLSNFFCEKLYKKITNTPPENKKIINLISDIHNFLKFLNKLLQCKNNNGQILNLNKNSSVKNKSKKIKQLRNNTDSLRATIQSSTNIIKQEIFKIVQTDQQLSYFESNINSINHIQCKIEAKISGFKKKKFVHESTQFKLANIIHFLFLLIVVFNCTYYIYFI